MLITITKIDPERDLTQAQEVFYKTWLATYPNVEHGITTADVEEFYKDRHNPEKIQKRIQGLKNLPENMCYLVARDGDRVIGACRATKEKDFNQLKAIYILPEYQGQGIGKMFWQELLKFFDLKNKIIVQVATYNKQAIGFYEKLGFVDNGKRFTEERHKMPVSGAVIPEMEMEILPK